MTERRRGSVRGRLTQLLAVALTIVLSLIGYAMTVEVRSYRAVTAAVESVSLALGVQGVVHQLQRERGLTLGLLGGDDRFAEGLAQQRRQTDSAVAALRGELDRGVPRGGEELSAAVRGLDKLVTVRAGADARTGKRAETFDFYTSAISGLSDVVLTSEDTTDPGLRRGLEALRTLGDVKESVGRERGFLSGVFAVGWFSGDEYVRFTEIRATKLAAAAEFERLATGPQKDAFAAAQRTQAGQQAARLEQVALLGAAGPLPEEVDPMLWFDSITTVIDDLRDVQTSVGDDITAHAKVLHREAETDVILAILVAFLAVVVLVWLVMRSIRSITVPLAKLAKDADTVASTGLPAAIAAVQAGHTGVDDDPVRVDAEACGEIVALAQSIDRVRTSAMTLAGEQALLRHNARQSLANLGHRNQNLLRRQISAISEFEQTELDPDALGKLFLLDHLATRMRRNAESLLVLVGETSPRRSGTPLPVVDVIRAALSEVEEYTRVELRGIDPVFISGSVVTEVAHLLAELIENGLSFSPPDRAVEIQGRRTKNGYLLVVTDYGIGMSAEQLDAANAKFRGVDPFLVAPTKFLGHYVIGMLAATLDIGVRLVESPTSGVSARVLLPTKLLAEAPVEPLPVIVRTRPSKALDDVPPSSGRTRNGLAKRTRRPAPEPVRPSAVETTNGRSPDDVRSMLSSFRNGHQRGTNRTSEQDTA
ncbi:HAMP domain-containing protein [Actinokineospora alba]|uniref:histidine kinase n=1 Tax=Actinokineospora alba TaxID=504798 RepID=A0A1H0QPU1_9PSEU|nr:ATP-binding protein [Actinokineospora alba]TDP70474.1 HAMP domain-containing protein [Actinokineospora alba]SDI30718.1 HAMP domain-containing protein [Actinokineospora alba]SDP18688.1 HAMP domain-containing protein [Actinokineospora alba]